MNDQGTSGYICADPVPYAIHLTELMNALKNQTPSSPTWYQVIDQVAGTLLAIELQRAQERERVAMREYDEVWLIAAATDMLEALQAMLARYDHDDGFEPPYECIVKARAAVENALKGK